MVRVFDLLDQCRTVMRVHDRFADLENHVLCAPFATSTIPRRHLVPEPVGWRLRRSEAMRTSDPALTDGASPCIAGAARGLSTDKPVRRTPAGQATRAVRAPPRESADRARARNGAGWAPRPGSRDASAGRYCGRRDPPNASCPPARRAPPHVRPHGRPGRGWGAGPLRVPADVPAADDGALPAGRRRGHHPGLGHGQRPRDRLERQGPAGRPVGADRQQRRPAGDRHHLRAGRGPRSPSGWRRAP